MKPARKQDGKHSKAAGHGFLGKPSHQTKNTPALAVMSVACPECKAAVDEPCLSRAGKRTQHASRIRMAARARNNTSQSGTLFAASLNRHQRKQIREAAGLQQTELAKQLGCWPAQICRWEDGTIRPNGETGERYGVWLRDHQLAEYESRRSEFENL